MTKMPGVVFPNREIKEVNAGQRLWGLGGIYVLWDRTEKERDPSLSLRSQGFETFSEYSKVKRVLTREIWYFVNESWEFGILVYGLGFGVLGGPRFLSPKKRKYLGVWGPGSEAVTSCNLLY